MANDDIFKIRGQQPPPMPQGRLAGIRDARQSQPTVHFRLQLIAGRMMESAFEKFIASQIGIAQGVREQAGKSQNHLREFLVTEIDRDSTFPRVLQKADTDFLGGSFARHTKAWPLNDIDVFVPLDGLGLNYLWYGVPQPYTVVSDDALQTNPLILSPERWMDGTLISSTKLIQGFEKVLRRKYPNTLVKDAQQAVNIQMSLGETEEEKGLGFDIVPCFRLRPHDPQENFFYLMPDGKNGWIHTNPRFDTQLNEELNRASNGLFRKAVKLVKYWNKERFGGLLNSYYVELAIMRAFRLRSDLSTLGSTSRATALAFDALQAAVFNGDQQSLFVKGAPPVQCGEVPPGDLLRLMVTRNTAEKAVELERNGSIDEAAKHWRIVFGDLFTTDA